MKHKIKDIRQIIVKVLPKKQIRENILVVLIMGALTFLFLLQSPIGPWTQGESNTDSSVFQTIAMIMRDGGMPYRDTFDHKGPLLYIINYIGSIISNPTGIWLFEFTALFITLLFLYKIARLSCGKCLSIICILFALTILFVSYDGGNYTEEYAMPFIAASTYIVLDYMLHGRMTKPRLFTCGLCFGSVLLLRPNMVSIWIVFGIAIFIQCVVKKQWKKLGRFIAFFMLGILAVCLPIITWLLVNGALQDCFDQYILFNLQYQGANNGHAQQWEALIFFIQPTIVTISLLCSIFVCIKEKHRSQRIVDIIYFLYIVMTIFVLCSAGGPSAHYSIILIPVVVFPVARMLGKVESSLTTQQLMLGAAALIYVCATFVAPDWIAIIRKDGNIYFNRHLTHISDSMQTTTAYINTNSASDDKITVYGNMDSIYVLSQKKPASKYSYQYPIGNISKEIFDRYFQDLNDNKPKFVIIDTRRDMKDDNRMQKYLDENNYTRVNKLDTKNYHVYERARN